MKSIQNLNSLGLGKLLIHNNGKIASTRKRKGFPFLQALWPSLSPEVGSLSPFSRASAVSPSSRYWAGLGPDLVNVNPFYDL